MSLGLKILSVFVTFTSLALTSFAVENSLVGINVKQTNTGDYNIQLKLDKSVQVKKLLTEKDSMTLVLNSTLPSESVEIIYDNAADLNNVIVQKKNGNNTVVLFQGKNIENSQIYTKELTTGKIKEINTKSRLSNIFFVVDKKILSLSVLAFFLIYSLLLHLRPQRKRYFADNLHNPVITKKQNDTLRNKNLNQTRKIPSINYNINTRFNNVNANMATPKDFVINNYRQVETEKIRKVG